MKILIVSEFMPYSFMGGLAKHAITLGNQLIKLGHEVDILGNGEYGNEKQLSEMGFNGSVYLDKAISQSKLIRRIEQYVKIYPLWLHILVAKRIAKSIKEHASGYDVVHYHGHYPLVANYIPESINLVVTHHDYSLSCLKKTFLHNNTKPCMPGRESESCAECHFGLTDRFRKWLVLRGVKAWRARAKKAVNRHKHIFVSKRLSEVNLAVLDEKNAHIYVVHNFIDCDLLRQQLPDSPSVKSDGQKLTIVISNNLDPHKGIKEFLEAAKTNELLGDIDIVIAGGGSQKEMLEARYRDKGVEFLGHIPHAEAIKLVSHSDIYVLSSIWEESCSTGALEALFLRKDVRALNRGGTPEFVEYTLDKSQLKLYTDMQALVSSIKEGMVFRGNTAIDNNFGACVTKKVKDILDVYK